MYLEKKDILIDEQKDLEKGVTKIPRDMGFSVASECDILGYPTILYHEYIRNHTEEFQIVMESVSKQEIMDEIKKLKRFVKQPITHSARYAKTKNAAAYIDVDPSFLDKKRREGVFVLGIHYYKPKNSNMVFWDIGALEKWIKTEGVEDENNKIIDIMFN